MRRLTSSIIVCSLLCASCAAPQTVTDVTPEQSSSSSVISDDVEAAKLQTLRTLFRENDHNFFVIISTGTDKAGANLTAREARAWVLPTDLTESLTPGLYAVVYGPFPDAESANARLQLEKSRYPKAYVKDAGALRVPSQLEEYAASIPVRGLVAIAGRVMLPLMGITIQSRWMEEGGSLCGSRRPAYRFMAMHDDEMLRDAVTPAERAFVFERTDGKPEEDQLTLVIYFEIDEETGEVTSSRFCWD